MVQFNQGFEGNSSKLDTLLKELSFWQFYLKQTQTSGWSETTS